MQLVAEDEAEQWMAEGGIGRHPRFRLSLAYSQAPDLQESWLPTGRITDLPGFLQTAVSLAAGGGPILLYRKGGGSWYEGDDAPIGNHIIDRVLEAIGVPREFAGALSFDATEWRDMYLVISTFFIWGWSVGEDVYIIPGSRTCLLMTSHHGELFATCPTVEALAAFAADMARRGHPAS
jgi:hypothetical protein